MTRKTGQARKRGHPIVRGDFYAASAWSSAARSMSIGARPTRHGGMTSSQPVAKRGDRIIGLDTHIVLVASPGGPIPTPTPMPFEGELDGSLSSSVFANNEELALESSTAENAPHHMPVNGTFQTPPSNQGTVVRGSGVVFADNRAVARANDPARSCTDGAEDENGHVMADATVFAG